MDTLDAIDTMGKVTFQAPRIGISEDLDVKNHELYGVNNK